MPSYFGFKVLTHFFLNFNFTWEQALKKDNKLLKVLKHSEIIVIRILKKPQIFHPTLEIFKTRKVICLHNADKINYIKLY